MRFNARLKAAAVAARFPESVVLAADTVGPALGREVFGKPRDLDDAQSNANQKLVGKTHEVITGIAMIETIPRDAQRFRAVSSSGHFS